MMKKIERNCMKIQEVRIIIVAFKFYLLIFCIVIDSMDDGYEDFSSISFESYDIPEMVISQPQSNRSKKT